MTFVRLQGGLGNQMFQYAAGRAMDCRRGGGLKFDTRFYASQSLRKFELDVFKLRCHTTNAIDEALIDLWKPQWNLTRKQLIARRLSSPFRVAHIVDKEDGSTEEVLKSRGNVFLDGYWQSVGFFQGAEPEIRNAFVFRDEPDEANRQSMIRIRETESICVHVRRGDYVQVPETNKYHGTCEPAYYHAASLLLAQRVRDPHFFVFSDDPQWTRDTLRFDGPTTYITHNVSIRNHEDLRLMMACKHFIIANSSFSWWGAWLSANPRKFVVAPARWYADPRQPHAHVVPKDWVRV